MKESKERERNKEWQYLASINHNLVKIIRESKITLTKGPKLRRAWKRLLALALLLTKSLDAVDNRGS